MKSNKTNHGQQPLKTSRNNARIKRLRGEEVKKDSAITNGKMSSLPASFEHSSADTILHKNTGNGYPHQTNCDVETICSLGETIPDFHSPTSRGDEVSLVNSSPLLDTAKDICECGHHYYWHIPEAENGCRWKNIKTDGTMCRCQRFTPKKSNVAPKIYKPSIEESFNNFWKVYSYDKRVHKKDRKKMYRAFLDGYGLAILNAPQHSIEPSVSLQKVSNNSGERKDEPIFPAENNTLDANGTQPPKGLPEHSARKTFSLPEGNNFKSKAQMNWEVGKEQQEILIEKLSEENGEEFIEYVKDILKQIRQNEYRRGKEDAMDFVRKTIKIQKEDINSLKDSGNKGIRIFELELLERELFGGTA